MARPMYQIITKGARAEIEAAWDALAWADPSPASAVDAKEEGRTHWRLFAYASDLDDAKSCRQIIDETSPGLNIRIEELEERDWVTLSLEGLPPVEAGPFIVAGSHVLAKSAPGKIAVLIEAGPAFGTGHHGTTLGCLQALDLARRGRRLGRVLDLGTGSGVLAIAALKAGASSVIGTDIERDSVRIARENARKNQVTGFKVLHCKGGHHPLVQRSAPYDTVFANIILRPLVRLAPEIAALTAPGGVVVLSGLLHEQEPLVRRAYESRGLGLTGRIREDGWSTLIMRRETSDFHAGGDAPDGPAKYAGGRIYRSVFAASGR